MRFSPIYLGLTLFGVMVLFALLLHGSRHVAMHDRELLPAKRLLVKRVSLTDLAVWTEARYARHPSQADLFAPFQDVPGSFDYFPSGAVLAPSSYLINTRIEFRSEKKGSNP